MGGFCPPPPGLTDFKKPGLNRVHFYLRKVPSLFIFVKRIIAIEVQVYFLGLVGL